MYALPCVMGVVSAVKGQGGEGEGRGDERERERTDHRQDRQGTWKNWGESIGISKQKA